MSITIQKSSDGSAQKKQVGGSVFPGLSLAAGGLGVSRLSGTLSDIFEHAGIGSSPRLSNDAIQFIDRFGDSLRGRIGDWDDFIYNYAQTGSDAAKVRAFVGRDVSLADDITSLKKDVMQNLGRPAAGAAQACQEGMGEHGSPGRSKFVERWFRRT